MKKILITLIALAAVSTATAKHFTIKNIQSNKCIDVTAASTENGANIQQYSCNGSSAQNWSVPGLPPEGPTAIGPLINENSNHFLSYIYSEGNNIVQIAGDGKTKHWWNLHHEGDNIFTIAVGRLCLDIEGASTESGANIQQSECDGSDTQKFIITQSTEIYSPTGMSTITNKKSGKLLDVTAASISNAANVQQYQSNGNYAQGWYIAPLNDAGPSAPEGYEFSYELFNINSGQVLDVAWGGNSDNIQQWPREQIPEYTPGSAGWAQLRDNQLWNFIPTHDGDSSYFIKSKSDLTECMEVEMGYTWDTANVQTAGCTGDDSQKWFVEGWGS